MCGASRGWPMPASGSGQRTPSSCPSRLPSAKSVSLRSFEATKARCTQRSAGQRHPKSRPSSPARTRPTRSAPPASSCSVHPAQCASTDLGDSVEVAWRILEESRAPCSSSLAFFLAFFFRFFFLAAADIVASRDLDDRPPVDDASDFLDAEAAPPRVELRSSSTSILVAAAARSWTTSLSLCPSISLITSTLKSGSPRPW
mmetsp:Transcript_22018/g.33196  ORF Transcript_22018/g.33196 Transcript_22018/m.33196 type:complete len:201 (-) Transcript_22018:237-839(-)